MNDEIKERETQSVRHKVVFMLMSDGVLFHHNEEDGIVFSAPESHVKNMVYRLVTCCGCSLKPVIAEYQRIYKSENDDEQERCVGGDADRYGRQDMPLGVLELHVGACEGHRKRTCGELPIRLRLDNQG